MKIGITCYPTYGGSGVVATELGLELAERSHEVHFISYAQPIRLTAPHPNIHYHEVEVSRYPLFDYPPYDLALATRMAEVSELGGGSRLLPRCMAPISHLSGLTVPIFPSRAFPLNRAMESRLSHSI